VGVLDSELFDDRQRRSPEPRYPSRMEDFEGSDPARQV